MQSDAERLAADEAKARGCSVKVCASADAEGVIAYYSAVVAVFGGAPEIVRKRERGDLGPVVHVLADGNAPRNVLPDEFAASLVNLNRFNRDIAREPVPQGADTLHAFQVRADCASGRLQQWTLHSLHGLYFVGGVAGAAQLIAQPPLSALSPLGTGVRLGLLALAFLWLRVAKREDYENRYQDYRAIAEALRVQEAWCAAGMRECLVETSYLQMQQSELRWIQLALRSIYLVSDASVARPADAPSAASCVEWVAGQRAYYERAAKVQAHKQKIVSAVSRALLVLGAVVSGAALVASLVNAHAPKTGATAWLLYFLTVPAAISGMVVLLLQFYSQQRGYGENARRYQRTYVVFDKALQRLHEGGSEDSKAILAGLGHEALSEHADWLILHRERPLRLISTSSEQ